MNDFPYAFAKIQYKNLVCLNFVFINTMYAIAFYYVILHLATIEYFTTVFLLTQKEKNGGKTINCSYKNQGRLHGFQFGRWYEIIQLEVVVPVDSRNNTARISL